MKITRIITTFLALFCCFIVSGQTSEFGIWTSAAIEKKFGKLNLSSEAEVRYRESINQISRLSIGVDAGYSIVKPLEVGVGYEFIDFYDQKYSDYQFRHRIYTYLTGKYKINRFTLSLKEKFQVDYKDDSDRIRYTKKGNPKTDTYRINPEWIWRNRLKIAYNVPKLPLTPSISAESFYSLNDPLGNEFLAIRYVAALDYEFVKRHTVKLYGLWDNGIESLDDVDLYVVGVGYTYSF